MDRAHEKPLDHRLNERRQRIEGTKTVPRLGSPRRSAAAWLCLLTGFLTLPASGAAQSPGPLTANDILPDGQVEGLASPVYAASPTGSPYSTVYSRTFGATGEAPLTDSPASAGPAPAPTAEDVVYIIDSKGLLTYRAEDFSRGAGSPVSHNPQPPPTAGAGAAPLQTPTVADSLYRQPPLETAAGPQPAATSEPGASPGPSR